MRFGPEKDYSNKLDALYRNLEYYGAAAFPGIDCSKPPEEAKDFVRAQYQRFGIPLPKAIEGLLSFGPLVAINHFNNNDPYALFAEFSDVSFTDDWQKFTYEIVYGDAKVEECDPELLETFVYRPGQAEAFFNTHIAMPGLKAFPQSLYITLEDSLNDAHDGCWLDLDTGTYVGTETLYERVEEVCTSYETGKPVINVKKVDAYFDLAVWAGTLWLLGPFGRECRIFASEIIESAMLHGECIMYDGVVYNSFRKIPRSPASCHVCGVDAWCVTPTLDDDGVFRQICEGCLRKGMPRFEGATCGTRLCKFTACPHHVYHFDAYAGLDMMRKHGQLAQMARDRRALQGAIDNRRLASGSG